MEFDRMIKRTEAKRDRMVLFVVDLDYSTSNLENAIGHWTGVDAIDRTIDRLRKERKKLVDDLMDDGEWEEYDNHDGHYEKIRSFHRE